MTQWHARSVFLRIRAPFAYQQSLRSALLRVSRGEGETEVSNHTDRQAIHHSQMVLEGLVSLLLRFCFNRLFL